MIASRPPPVNPHLRRRAQAVVTSVSEAQKPRQFCRGFCFFGLRDGAYRFSCFSASMGFSLRIFRVA